MKVSTCSYFFFFYEFRVIHVLKIEVKIQLILLYTLIFLTFPFVRTYLQIQAAYSCIHFSWQVRGQSMTLSMEQVLLTTENFCREADFQWFPDIKICDLYQIYKIPLPRAVVHFLGRDLQKGDEIHFLMVPLKRMFPRFWSLSSSGSRNIN